MKSFILSFLVIILLSIFSVSLFGFAATEAARTAALPLQTGAQPPESEKKAQQHTVKTRRKKNRKHRAGHDMSGMKMGKEKPPANPSESPMPGMEMGKQKPAAQPSEPAMPGMEMGKQKPAAKPSEPAMPGMDMGKEKPAAQPSQPAMSEMEMGKQRSALKPMETGGGSVPEMEMNPYFTALNYPVPKDMMMIMVLPDFQSARSTRNFLTGMTMVEYGVTPRWTVMFMAEGQKIPGMPMTYGGLRFGTYFHILPHSHLLNFTLYGEYEGLNEAALYKMEVAGFGGEDLSAPLAEARGTPVRTFEQRAILYHDWGRVNLSFNFISETGLDTHENDFGYTWGVFRKAAWTGMDMGKETQGMDMGKGTTEINGTKSSAPPALSIRRLGYGLEMIGALGNQHQFGFVWPREQQYVGPVFNYALSQHWNISVEPTFGLSHVSDPFVLRMGFRYSIDHLLAPRHPPPK